MPPHFNTFLINNLAIIIKLKRIVNAEFSKVIGHTSGAWKCIVSMLCGWNLKSYIFPLLLLQSRKQEATMLKWNKLGDEGSPCFQIDTVAAVQQFQIFFPLDVCLCENMTRRSSGDRTQNHFPLIQKDLHLTCTWHKSTISDPDIKSFSRNI